MEPQTIAKGLIRWTAKHPAWRPGDEPESPGDWPQDVGCVGAIVGDVAVIIDPLVSDEDWPVLDEFVAGREVRVIKTIRFHARSCAEAREHWNASKQPPEGVVGIPVPDETMYWIPEHATLVPGDRLMGDGAGGLRMCPESWLGYIGEHLNQPTSLDDLREALQPLLDLPVERVLVSHGDPVLSGGAVAIKAALR